MLLTAMAVALSAPLPRNHDSWITDSDYPRDAYAVGQQGQVTAALTIDESGEPEQCAVRASTAPADLAKLTCTLLVQRARFQPARDERGKTVTGTFVQIVQWSLPNVAALADSGYITRFDIGDGGVIANCSVVAVGGQTLDRQTASMCTQLKSEQALAMFVRKPLEKFRSVDLRFLLKVDRANHSILVSPPNYDFRRVISTADFDLLSSGGAGKCSTTSSESIGGKLIDACEMLGLKSAGGEAADGEAAGASHGQATFDAIGFYR